jgi:hypothetical protein
LPQDGFNVRAKMNHGQTAGFPPRIPPSNDVLKQLPLPGKGMFGGTPNIARETHALPAQGVVAFGVFLS